MSQNALQYFPCSSEPLKPDPGLKASGGHESKRGPKKVRRKTPQNAAKLSLLRTSSGGWRRLSTLESAGHFVVARVRVPSSPPFKSGTYRQCRIFRRGKIRHKMGTG